MPEWKYDPTPVDLTAAAPGWTESVELLTNQIDSLRSTPMQLGYTGFSLSIVRNMINKALPEGRRIPANDMANVIRTAFELLDTLPPDAPLRREMNGLLDFTPNTIHHLQNAVPIYVTDEMMRLADVATDSLPYDVPITPQLMLEPSMWLCFEHSIPLLTLQGEVQFVKAVLVTSDVIEDESVPGIDLIYYTDIRDPRDESQEIDMLRRIGSVRLFPGHVGGLAFGSQKHWLLPEEFDDAVVKAKTEWADRPEVEQATVKQSGLNMIRFERFVTTILMMLSQKEVRVVEGRDRAVQRRLVRAQKQALRPSLPRVVMLRRREYAAGTGEKRPVEWKQRWVRRAHWRQYREGKWTFVMAHVCGPSELDLALRDHVYTWER